MIINRVEVCVCVCVDRRLDSLFPHITHIRTWSSVRQTDRCTAFLVIFAFFFFFFSFGARLHFLDHHRLRRCIVELICVYCSLTLVCQTNSRVFDVLFSARSPRDNGYGSDIPIPTVTIAHLIQKLARSLARSFFLVAFDFICVQRGRYTCLEEKSKKKGSIWMARCLSFAPLTCISSKGHDRITKIVSKSSVITNRSRKFTDHRGERETERSILRLNWSDLPSMSTFSICSHSLSLLHTSTATPFTRSFIHSFAIIIASTFHLPLSCGAPTSLLFLICQSEIKVDQHQATAVKLPVCLARAHKGDNQISFQYLKCICLEHQGAKIDFFLSLFLSPFG